MLKASGPTSTNRATPVRMVVLSTLLFIASSSFMLFLSSGTLAELSRGIHLSAYRRVGERLRLSLERGLRFGRPLEGYAGLREQMDYARNITGGLDGIAVAGTDGMPIAVSGAGDWRAWNRAGGEAGAEGWFPANGRLLLSLPLTGREGRQEGFIRLAADPEWVRQEQVRFWEVSLAVLAGLGAVLALGLSGWAAASSGMDRERLARRRYRLCLLFAGGGQLLFCLALMWLFEAALADAEKAKIAVTARTAVWDIERLLARNVRVEQVRGLQSHFEAMRRDNPEIVALRLTGGDRATESGSAPSSPPLESRAVRRYWPDSYTPWRETARLEVWMNPAGVRSALWGVGKNLVTALLVSLLLLNEMARFITLSSREAAEEPAAERGGSPSGPVRMLAFGFFIAYDMSMSFVPLYAAALSGKGGLVSPAIAAALPLTLEAALVGAGMLLAGNRRLGGRSPLGLRLGIVLALLGSLFSWLAGDVVSFCLARSVAGLGFGVFFMSSQLILLGGGGRAKQLGELNSGVLSGSLCGLAGGAMAAELLGFGWIFAVSALAFFPALLLTWTRFTGARGQGGHAPGVPALVRRTGDGAGRRRFYLSFPFLGQVLLVALPAALTLAGLVFYSLPILLKRVGTTQGDIGRVLMIHGLCVILAGPVFGRLADAGRRYGCWIAMGGTLTALAVLLVRLWPALPGFALATAACGLGYAALNSSGMARISGFAERGGIDTASVAGLYRFAERLGQMSGPLVFGMLIGGGGGGFVILSLVLLGGAGIFWFASKAGCGLQGEA